MFKVLINKLLAKDGISTKQIKKASVS